MSLCDKHHKAICGECNTKKDKLKIKCHACGMRVIPKQINRNIMRHQGMYVGGFSLSVEDTECPECGEKGI